MSNLPVGRKPMQWRTSVRERQLIILLGDLSISVLAFIVAAYFWAQPDWLNFSFEFVRERIPLWFYFLPIFWVVLLIELYDLRRAAKFSEVVKGVFIAVLIYLGLYLLIYFTSEPNSLPRRGVAVFLLTAFVLTLLWRFLYIKIFTAQAFLRRVLIVGAGNAGVSIAKIVNEIWPLPFYIVGFIDDDENKVGNRYEGYEVLGTSEDLRSAVNQLHITNLILSISSNVQPKTFQALLLVQESGVDLTTMPKIYEELLGRIPITLTESDWLLRSFVDQVHTSSFYDLTKRIIDLVVGFLGLLVTLILFPFISLAILLDSGTPVVYSQNRLGKNGKTFRIFKFRTMIQDAEKDGQPRAAEENDARITRVGKFLRKSHLDEFPQFWNIMRGEMSLVGPRAERPELADEWHKSIPFYRARFLVKPGATGWAQVNFGYASTVEASTIKLEYDLYYIKRKNLLLDLSIILRTVGTVFGFQGR